MAPLCHAMHEDAENFEMCICVTGQHREMLDQVLDIFEIKPAIDLNVMKHGQNLSEITSSILSGMTNLFRSYKPDMVLVHGDTTSAFAAATAAFYERIPVGHVEAGLRTFDINAPFPEEFNRQVISKISSLHFAPTEFSKDNLLDEGHDINSIEVTGNTVIDSLFWILDRIDQEENRRNDIEEFLSNYLPFEWLNAKYILITGHRRENFGDGFINICEALAELASNFPEIHFIYPVHLNPNVQKPVFKMLKNHANIHLVPPLDYEPFVYLLRHCYFVLTDSGGIQEEAPSLGKPVLVMRDVTERPEAIIAGTVELVGANKDQIVLKASQILKDNKEYLKMSKAHNPYGDGAASHRILKRLRGEFNV